MSSEAKVTTAPLDLYEQWANLNDKELLKNPISIRFPVHILARIAALTEIFPKASRSEFIVTLVKLGLAQMEESSFPLKDHEYVTDVPSSEFAIGMMYRKLANKHYKKMVKENDLPGQQEIFPSKKP